MELEKNKFRRRISVEFCFSQLLFVTFSTLMNIDDLEAGFEDCLCSFWEKFFGPSVEI